MDYEDEGSEDDIIPNKKELSGKRELMQLQKEISCIKDELGELELLLKQKNLKNQLN